MTSHASFTFHYHCSFLLLRLLIMLILILIIISMVYKLNPSDGESRRTNLLGSIIQCAV